MEILCSQFGIGLHERVPVVEIIILWGSQNRPNSDNRNAIKIKFIFTIHLLVVIVVAFLLLQFRLMYLKKQTD